MKYAGAGDIIRLLDNRSRSISNLGIKSANVLGQVFRGIYHIKKNRLLKANWDSNRMIRVRIDSQLSTFDGNELTLLVECCKRAEIACMVSGVAFKGTAIYFMDPSGIVATPKNMHALRDGSDLFDNPGAFCHLNKKLRHSTYSRDGRLFAFYSIKNATWPVLQALVTAAHRDCVRVGLEGRSQHSLELSLHQRSKGAHEFCKRHPELKAHVNQLKGVIDVDYRSLEK